MNRKYRPSEIVNSINTLNQYIQGEIKKINAETFNPIENYLNNSEEMFLQPDREKIDRGLIALLISDLKFRSIDNKPKD